MTKYYVTDGDNKFLIDTKTHLQACGQAVQNWKNKKKDIGKLICFSHNGFSITGNNCIETKIIEGISLKYG